LLPPGALPRTVKGSAQRGKAEKEYKSELGAALQGTSVYPTLASDDDMDTVDSLQLGAAEASERPTETWKNNMMFAGMVLVTLGHAHFTPSDSVAYEMLSAVTDTFGGVVIMPFFFVLSGAGVPESAPTPNMLRSLFCYLCVSAYLASIWSNLLIPGISSIFIVSQRTTVLSGFLDELVGHTAWFLYTLFALRGMLYPLVGTNKYTLFAATLAGALCTELWPASFIIAVSSPSPQHAYLTMPLVMSVYFFGGIWLTRLKVFSAAASALLRYPWARLGGVLLFLAAVLTPCFLVPYQAVSMDLFPVNTSADITPYQPTGPFTLPAMFVYVIGLAALIPVLRLPMITGCGSRTLNGYLMLKVAVTVDEVVHERLFVPVLTNQDVANWIAMLTLVPLITVLMTSELVAVAMWPITQPTWAVALLTGTETAPPPVAQRWASAAAGHMGSWTPAWWARFGEWAVFAPLFLLFTSFIAGMDTLDHLH